MSKRVVVGMSGGVDSSVAAAILQEKGYEVIGLTMRFWGTRNRCCSLEDVRDAQKVAAQLGIRHYLVHFEEAFKQHVVDYFVDEYIQGRTPNPCAVCNPQIKFGEMWKKARALGADFLATGHYATITRPGKPGEKYRMRRGKERGKDQSYFLARLSQEQLAHTLFPLGTFPKEKIRELARRFGLNTASKKESQEVCFIPDGDVGGFIRRQSGREFPCGEIVDGSGNVLGEHHGIINYTIGQRKGLGIALGKPAYVTRIDAQTNRITVGDNDDLYHSEFTCSGIHWLSGDAPGNTLRVKARIRYTHKPEPAYLTMEEQGLRVRFDKPQRAITPGQLAVFYQEDTVLGSAWIDTIKA